MRAPLAHWVGDRLGVVLTACWFVARPWDSPATRPHGQRPACARDRWHTGTVTDWRADDPGAPRETDTRDESDVLDISTLELPGMPGAELVPVRPPQSERDADREIRDGDVDGWGRSERVRAVARRLYDPVYRRWFRVEWEGLEHIPREGGALIIANHGGAIPSDAPVIMHGVETELGARCTDSPTTCSGGSP